MAYSKATKEEIKQLVRDANITFKTVDIFCKGLTFDGEDPLEEVSCGGASIGKAGLLWFPKIGMVSVPIPRLHFGRIRWEDWMKMILSLSESSGSSL